MRTTRRHLLKSLAAATFLGPGLAVTASAVAQEEEDSAANHEGQATQSAAAPAAEGDEPQAAAAVLPGSWLSKTWEGRLRYEHTHTRIEPYTNDRNGHKGWYDGSRYVIEKGDGQVAAQGLTAPHYWKDWNASVTVKMESQVEPDMFVGIIWGKDFANNHSHGYLILRVGGSPTPGNESFGIDVFLMHQIQDNGKWSGWNNSAHEYAKLMGINKGPNDEFTLAVSNKDGEYSAYLDGILIEDNWKNSMKSHSYPYPARMDQVGPGSIGVAVGQGAGRRMVASFENFLVEGRPVR